MTLEEILLAAQTQTPARLRGGPGANPLAALLSGIGPGTGGPPENFMPMGPQYSLPQPPPLPVMADPLPKLPSFIQLGPQARPPQAPMFSLPEFLATMDKSGSQAASAAPMPMGLPAGRMPATPMPVPPAPAFAMPAMPNMATSALGQFVTGNVDPGLAAPVSPVPLPQGSAGEYLQQLLGGMVPTRTGKTYSENITVGPGSTSSPSQGATAAGPPAAPPMRFGLPAPSTPGAGTTTRTMTINPSGAQPAADPKILAMQTIRGFEGLRTSPYWDVNALRTGYGSDTVTLADGTVKKVTEGMKITAEDAERDLERRTNEFMGTVKGQIGETAFASLTPNQQAALTSVAYNYGKLPDRVVDVIKGGGNVAAAIQGLGSDNDGVNAKRRLAEANLWDGGGSNPMPGAPDISAPRLPIPGATTPLRGLPANAFDQFNQLGVTRPPPRNPVDNIVAILGAMSGAAAGAKNAGDLLAAVGGAGGQQAARNVNLSREEGKEFSQREDAMKRFQAEIGVRRAEAETQAENYRIEAQNRDKTLLNTVATEQAKLDTAAKNRVNELKNEIDWKKWERFEPQIKVDKDGVTIVKRKPDGSMDITSTRGQDMDAQAERMRNAATIYGKDSQTVDVLQYQALAQGPLGETAVRRQIMKDMVDRGQTIDVLGPEQYKALEKEATKGLDMSLQGRPEFDAQKKQRMLDLLWSQLQGRDEVWLPKLLQKGNIGAAMLARPGG